ncbi:MAG: hypothetical protein ACREV7_23150, partial [Steroidobacteraceae bacterium]
MADMAEQSDKPGSINAEPTQNEDASAARAAKSAQTPPESRAVPQEPRKATRKRKLLFGVLGVAVLATLLVFGIPSVEEMLNSVSTDPASSEGGGDLGQVPPDLDETFASVLEAQAELIQGAAQLGVLH